MKTGLVNYKISEHGAGLGVVVKRARVSHICDECTSAITPKTVYVEHPIRFGSPLKAHVKCAEKLELVEPLAHVDVHGDEPTDTYFIDYDHNDTSAVFEEVKGDIKQHIMREVRRMYRSGVYGDGPFAENHIAAYARTMGVSYENRDRLTWHDVLVPVGHIERED
jgi:hypothetical protein